MERDTHQQSDLDSKLLLAAVAMICDGSKDNEPNQKSVTPESPKLRSKSTSRSCTKKPTTLPNETVEYLKAWMMSPEHIAHPYPTEAEKSKIMEDTGLELKQLTNWFVNNRKRYWKPRVEANLHKDQEVISEAANSSSQVDNSDRCETSSMLEKCGIGTSMVENVSDTPSSLRVSIRKGQTEKSNLIEDTTKPLLFVTPNPYTSSTNAHLISGHNSSASHSDGTTSCSDSDDERLVFKVPSSIRKLETTVSERIDVHILRPALSSSTFPELSDVTVLPNVAHGRILKCYPACQLSYSSYTKKSFKSRHLGLRRDSEILRLKKHCLSLFRSEHENFSNIRTGNETDDSLPSLPNTPKDIIATKRKHEIHFIPNGWNENHCVGTMASIMVSPRPKYRRRSIDVWKEACQTANHVYDDDELPSLEEATRLFGYAMQY